MEQMRDGMDEMLELEGRRAGIRLLLLFLMLAAGFIASLAVGRYYIPVSEILAAFSGGQVADKTSQVLMVVRLPRVLAAVLVGGAMSVSGAAYQGMFKNPLVSPDILGSSAGAGFGAALAILLSLGVAGIKGAAFFFGLFAVMVTWLISRRFGSGDDSLFLLILGGIIVSNLFQSLISLVKYAADPTDKLPAITFWLMGSLSKAVMKDVMVMLVPFALCTTADILRRAPEYLGPGGGGGQNPGNQHRDFAGGGDCRGHCAHRLLRVPLRYDRLGGAGDSPFGPDAGGTQL